MGSVVHMTRLLGNQAICFRTIIFNFLKVYKSKGSRMNMVRAILGISGGC